MTNDGDVDATVHWHGLRLENRYDGVPHETQAPIPIGGTFTYKVQFPDAGLLLVPPSHPRRLRPGNGSLRHHHRRALRCPRIGRGRPATDPHPGRSARRGRADRPVPPIWAELHRDGPLRQRPADQRRDRVLRRGGSGRSRAPVSGQHGEHPDLQLRASAALARS